MSYHAGYGKKCILSPIAIANSSFLRCEVCILRTIHAQLSSIFNHAIRYYDLSSNPAKKAGTMGEEEGKEMLFWTKEEYEKFAEEMMDKTLSYYAFEMLYWCGIREGELLALTPEDFDFEAKTVRINKTYHKIEDEDVVTPPKNEEK